MKRFIKWAESIGFSSYSCFTEITHEWLEGLVRRSYEEEDVKEVKKLLRNLTDEKTRYQLSTIIAKQDLSEKDIKNLIIKYGEVIKNSSGKVLKIEEWGLLSLSKKINNYKKGFFIHIKFEGVTETLVNIKNKIKVDGSIIRNLTVKYKQLDKETDARFVGYFAALGEGSLALITIVAVSGAALAATPELWHEIYDKYGSAGAGTFIQGGAQLITNGWGIPVGVSTTLLATMVALFAGTTMDSGVRLQRYIIQEWGDIYDIALFKKGIFATLLAVTCCLLLAFGAGGASGTGGLSIWPLFGSTNQILAAMTLLVISVMLIKMGRPARYTLIPMIFVLVTSSWAAVIKLMEFWAAGNWLLVTIDIVVLVTSLMVILEAISVIVQVISFKLTGKRVFRMAPIHHHFEKKGWAESTVVIRFWIISIILAMIGLATLKLR